MEYKIEHTQKWVHQISKGVIFAGKKFDLFKKNALMHFFGIRFIITFGPKKFLAAPKEITSDPFYGHWQTSHTKSCKIGYSLSISLNVC